jgi:YD repeat-containing protein
VLNVTRADSLRFRAGSLVTRYKYDDQDKLLSYGGRDYTHDARGRATSRSAGAQTTQLEWDDDDRLASLTLPNGQKLAYIFDVSGRRATLSIDGTIQHKLLSNGLQLLAQQDANGQLTQRYIVPPMRRKPL